VRNVSSIRYLGHRLSPRVMAELRLPIVGLSSWRVIAVQLAKGIILPQLSEVICMTVLVRCEVPQRDARFPPAVDCPLSLG